MSTTVEKPVAILYQAAQPPAINGVIKPMKPGGYSDSGADIAYVLCNAKIPIITPVSQPDPAQVLDWVFPDTHQGIDKALSLGAQVLWLNTILFKSHPIQEYFRKGINVVGQDPDLVDIYDDKRDTNELLGSRGLPIPDAFLLRSSQEVDLLGQDAFSFPLVVKPIRGRGSAGVVLTATSEQLRSTVDSLLNSLEFGDALLVETYLPGQEVTLTIMPPGHYQLDGQLVRKPLHWSLPPVKRFNHQDGIAPYNGTKAVIENSQVLSTHEQETLPIQKIMYECEKAAKIVGARAPIRIDCRQDASGRYFLFDLNMKPNMTGAGRPGRDNQSSLSAIAAQQIGWSYPDLLLNMLAQQWSR